MSNNFQRDGSVSNSHVGRDFENRARKVLARCGLWLTPDHKVPCGLAKVRKDHTFDLGSEAHMIPADVEFWELDGDELAVHEVPA